MLRTWKDFIYMKLINTEFIKFIIKVILASLFSYSLFFKLFNYEHFLFLLKSNQIFPLYLVHVISIFVILSEVLLIYAILFIKNQKIWSEFSLFVLILFTTYFIFIKYLNPNSDCGCGGIFSKISFMEHLIINFVLIALNITFIKLNDNNLPQNKKAIV